MRVNSIRTFDARSAMSLRPAKNDGIAKPAVEPAPVSSTTTEPTPRGKAHGVMKKLGTGHYSAAVEAKLTARFAPERLVPPAAPAPSTDPITDPPTDPVVEPSDPILDPQIIPNDETPTDPQPLPENELTTALQSDVTRPAGNIVTRETTSAFANFNLLDFTNAATIDLIA